MCGADGCWKRWADIELTLGQVGTVALLGDDVGDDAGGTARATLLDGGGVLGRLDREGGLLRVLGGQNDALARLGGLNADSLGVDNTRVLQAQNMQSISRRSQFICVDVDAMAIDGRSGQPRGWCMPKTAGP
jgi:hypothetical protein